MRIVSSLLCCFVLSGPAQAAEPEALKVKEGETYYGIREVPDFKVDGRYTYKSADLKPWIILNPDGSGIFQSHQKIDIAITWWIESTAKGEVKLQKGEIGRRYMLIVRYRNGDYQPAGSYDFFPLTIRTDLHKAFILGEREKPYP